MTRVLAGVVAVMAAGVTAWVLVRPPAAPAGATTAAPPSSARAFWDAYKAAGDRRARGDCAGAIEHYTRALSLRPAHEDSLYYMGNCHAERGERDAAMAAYQRLVEVNPAGSSRGYMQMGLLLAAPGPDGRRDLAGAERLFTRALEVDSDSGALLGLAEVALLRHRWDEAARRLEAASADNAMSIAAPFFQAYLAFRDGDRARALTLFTTAVARGELKKGPVAWSEEGDVKADPELRWRALARQSVLGGHWAGLRKYLAPPGPTMADLEREMRALEAAIGS
jgi:tetratricopeptide (TPR) repeat protein